MAQFRRVGADARTVRLLKLILGIAMIASLAMMWAERDRVVSAYVDDAPPVDLRLDGIDLATSLTEIEPSPYTIAVRPDLRREPVVVLDSTARAVPPTELSGGSTTMTGFVLGPEGPVVGATVRLERHTAAGIAAIDTTTDDLGNWSATGMAGGRWRVRSFVPNLWTSGAAVVQFVADGDQVRVDSVVSAAPLAPLIELVGPEETITGFAYTYAVTVGIRRVDEQGRILVVPATGAEVRAVATTSALTSNDVVAADAGGAARFLLTCGPLGTPTLNLAVTTTGVTHSTAVALAPCVPEPPPEPTEDEITDDQTTNEAESTG